MSTIAFSGTTIERNATSSSRNANASTKRDHVRHAVLHLAREVDVLGGDAGDRGLDARHAPERLRHELAPAASRSARLLAALSPAPVSGSSIDAAVPSGLPLTVNGGCAIPRATASLSRRPTAAAPPSAAGRGGPATTTIAGADVLGNSARTCRASRGPARSATESDSSLGFADVQRERRERERDEQAGGERRSESTGRRSTRSTTAGQKRESAVSVSRCGRIRDPAAVDPRRRAARARPGSTVTEPATAHATTAIVPLAMPVEDVGADHEHAGHRDHDGRARDEDRAARGAGRPLERLVRRQAAMPLLARADDVEERVVDADGHPDQEHDRLDAVVEREDLADRAEQAERRDHGGQREQDRHERRDDRRRTRTAGRSA